MLDDNDHRHLGRRLNLFFMQEHAPGMVFWQPSGFLLFEAMKKAVRRLMRRSGLAEVGTPQLLRNAVWQASGHAEHFAANMYGLDDGDEQAALKPVSCPGHMLIAKGAALSYRDLPYRLGELGLVHRNERSGTLHGLFRLRQFTQDDGHIFCGGEQQEEQLLQEVVSFCNSLSGFYAAFGFPDVRLNLATRPERRVGDDLLWDRAEATLAEAVGRAGLSCGLAKGEGAFYGPKLEFVLRDRVGRDWQCGTIQLDFFLPERFGVEYTDADGRKKVPAMLHRAVFGSVERFLAILLEHCEGRVPAWLSPGQVLVVPVTSAQHAYAAEVQSAFAQAGLRVAVDDRAESLSRRVRDARESGVSFLAVVGAREQKARSVSLSAPGHSLQSFELARAVFWLEDNCRAPV